MSWLRRVWATVKLAFSLYGMIALCACAPTVQGLREASQAANEAAPVVVECRACMLNACVDKPLTSEAEILACVKQVQAEYARVEKLFTLMRRIHCTVDPSADGCTEAPSSIVGPFIGEPGRR